MTLDLPRDTKYRDGFVFYGTVVVFCIILFLIYIIPSDHKVEPLFSGGELHLAGKELTIMPLTGEWACKRDVLTMDDWSDAQYVMLPQLWTDHRFGCASYRLVIHGLEAGRSYSMRVPYMATAYSLFLNGTLMSKNGRVGFDRASSVPGYLPKIVEFTASGGADVLILQVSNFHHRRGGPFQIISLGKVNAIAQMDEERVFIDWAFVIIYLTMGLYQLVLFFVRKEKSILFLALFFVFAGFEGMIQTPEVLLFRIFPSFSWVFYEKLCYLISYAIPIWLLLFGYDLFGGISRFVLFIFLVPLVMILLFVLWTPPYVFSLLTVPFQIYAIGIFGIVLGMIALAIYRKHPGAKIFAFGYLLFTGTLLSSIFFANNRILDATNLPLSFLAYYKVSLFQRFSIPIASFSYILILISINIMSLSYFYKHPEVMKKKVNMGAAVASLDLNQKFQQYDLSPRESEIVRLMLEGRTNTEIAKALFISLSTVKTHVSHIFQKTGTKTREELFFLLQDIPRK